MVAQSIQDPDQPMPEVETRVLWKSISAMQSAFHFSEDEMLSLLGAMHKSKLHRGLSSMDVDVSGAVRDRVSLLLGIYKGVHTLFGDTDQANTWIDRPNELPPFDGDTPRALVVSGDLSSLAAVRNFVDQWCV